MSLWYHMLEQVVRETLFYALPMPGEKGNLVCCLYPKARALILNKWWVPFVHAFQMYFMASAGSMSSYRSRVGSPLSQFLLHRIPFIWRKPNMTLFCGNFKIYIMASAGSRSSHRSRVWGIDWTGWGFNVSLHNLKIWHTYATFDLKTQSVLRRLPSVIYGKFCIVPSHGSQWKPIVVIRKQNSWVNLKWEPAAPRRGRNWKKMGNKQKKLEC